MCVLNRTGLTFAICQTSVHLHIGLWDCGTSVLRCYLYTYEREAYVGKGHKMITKNK